MLLLTDRGTTCSMISQVPILTTGNQNLRNTKESGHSVLNGIQLMDPGADETRQVNGVVYRAHLCIYKCIVQMDPTTLEKLDGFERNQSGYKFVPEDTNVRLTLLGNDWSEKRILVYGTNSSETAIEYVETLIQRVREIGHDAKLIGDIEISNISVNGDFGESLRLERAVQDLRKEEIDVQYEPEQFPAIIVKLENPATTFLLFSNGKFSIQGLKKRECIEPRIIELKEILEQTSINL